MPESNQQVPPPPYFRVAEIAPAVVLRLLGDCEPVAAGALALCQIRPNALPPTMLTQATELSPPHSLRICTRLREST
eukprot:1260670-Pleurochrysis_carterae.AAC.1